MRRILVVFRLAGTTAEDELPANAAEHTFQRLKLAPGDARLEAWAERGGAAAGPLDVVVTRVE
jgi:hypothetical protein